MSTNDVPGASASNNDILHQGCWAEHEDGSLIYVYATEGGRVVYEMFDMSAAPIIRFSHAYAEAEFKRRFSWPPAGTSTEKWTWHDKTHFPWDRVIAAGDKPATRYGSADDMLSAAARVAKSIGVEGTTTDVTDLRHLIDQVTSHPAAQAIIKGVQEAISKLRAGK